MGIPVRIRGVVTRTITLVTAPGLRWAFQRNGGTRPAPRLVPSTTGTTARNEIVRSCDDATTRRSPASRVWSRCGTVSRGTESFASRARLHHHRAPHFEHAAHDLTHLVDILDDSTLATPTTVHVLSTSHPDLSAMEMPSVDLEIAARYRAVGWAVSVVRRISRATKRRTGDTVSALKSTPRGLRSSRCRGAGFHRRCDGQQSRSGRRPARRARWP